MVKARNSIKKSDSKNGPEVFHQNFQNMYQSWERLFCNRRVILYDFGVLKFQNKQPFYDFRILYILCILYRI